MKKIVFIFAVTASLISCKKTTEALTLLGQWEVESYILDGNDQTTLFKATYENYLLTFYASKNFVETYTVLGVNNTSAGPWIMTNNGNDFELTNQADNVKRYFNIIELNPSSATISEDSGTSTSDLDLVIVYEILPHAYQGIKCEVGNERKK